MTIAPFLEYVAAAAVLGPIVAGLLALFDVLTDVEALLVTGGCVVLLCLLLPLLLPPPRR